MAGIYKITTPSGKVYIGQSWDTEKRKKTYNHPSGVERQRLLYNSWLKYGWDNHKFEVIHELPNDITQEVLDRYETLYIAQYRECGAKVLNLKEGGSRGRLSEEAKQRMSDSHKGKKKPWVKGGRPAGFKHSEESKQKRRDKLKGRVSPNKGNKLSEEAKRKIGQAVKERWKRIKKLVD